MIGPYRERAPDPMRAAEQSWLRRVVTRVWRRWQVFLARPYRERAARCKVCGKPFEWESRDVTVPPMCRECLEEREREPVVWLCQRCAGWDTEELSTTAPTAVTCAKCGKRCEQGARVWRRGV